MDVFTGVGVALVTLFDESGQVDAAATGALAADLVSEGIRGVLACGTTGEAATLTDCERVRVIQAIRGAVPASVPLLAGTGAITTERAIVMTAAAVDAGADAILAWPPPGSADLGHYFESLAKAANDRPVLAYHIPSVSSPGVSVNALTSLPVVGQKDSSGDPNRLLDELANYSGSTYVGSSALLALAGPLGATGAILALANVEPELCCAAFDGDAAAQLQLANSHLAAREGGPPELKRMLARRRGTVALSRSHKA